MRSREYEDGYDAAMAEAAGAVQLMDRKVRDLERALAAAVVAAGGSVDIPRSLLVRCNKFEIIRHTDEANDCIVFRAKV